MKEKLESMLLVTLFVLSIMVMLPIPRANSDFPSDKPTLWVDDYEFCCSCNLTCTNFNITVNIFNVTDMKGCAVKLGYNNTLLEAIKVYPTDITDDTEIWLPNNATGVFNFDKHPTINNTRTYAPDYAYVWVNASGFTFFSGSGAVFTVEFHIIKAPPRYNVMFPENKSVSCVLDLYETEVLDLVADPIDHYVEDGSYTYIRPQHCACLPTAVCNVYPSTVYVGGNITFDASLSHDGGFSTVYYLWDVNSDGTYEINTTSTITGWYCDTPGTHNVTLVVAAGFCDIEHTDADISYWTVVFAPVGGISIPVNKLALLAPYIGLTILLAVAVVAVVYVKKRNRNSAIDS